ncbi:MAG: hypothetical protein ABL956_10870 [Hyphomonadaceae bacterium]
MITIGEVNDQVIMRTYGTLGAGRHLKRLKPALGLVRARRL